MAENTHNQKIGRIGEDIAAKHLENKGFRIVGLNYRKKYGEIDIIAQKGGKIHFVEVKSVSCEIKPLNVSRVTDNYRPEDNIHPQKMKRLSRTIQAYLLEKFQDREPEWQFDAITVKIDPQTKCARVRILGDLIL